MTPRQLFAWCEIMDRAQMHRDTQLAAAFRAAKANQKDWQKWLKKQQDQSE